MADWIGQNSWLAAAVFLASAAAVWIAGTKLAGYADRFATATGLSGAVVGLVLLGGITSLPEVATSISGVLTSGPSLAVNNLLGGVAFQLVILAVVDAMLGRKALTAQPPRPDVIAYAAMNVVLLAVAAMAVVSGDRELFGTGIGVGSVLLVVAYAACVWTARSLSRDAGWRPIRKAATKAGGEGEAADGSIVRLSLLLAAAGGFILAAGYTATVSGEALARQTGLGTSFFGAVFLAGATSLPELSSAWAALKLNRAQMAMGDILGGNMFDVLLIALVDALYREGPAMGAVGPFSAAAAMLGALMSGVYIMGLVERRDRTVLRVGWDSGVVLLLYAGGLVVLFSLRGGG
jgi:cation:H+ antiporter